MLIIWENVKLMPTQKPYLKLMQMLNFFKLLLLMLDMVLPILAMLLLMLDIQHLQPITNIPLNVKLIQKGNARRFLYRPRVKWLCPAACLSLCVYLCPAHTAPQ